MTLELFASHEASRQPLGPGAAILRGFARARADALLDAVEAITSAAPFRHLVTPGGHRMSVAMTNCGARGWTSDTGGYRYREVDPDSGRAWPPMPAIFAALAREAAAELDFADYEPDACLVNRYVPGSKLSLHQDLDERDGVAPIVSVSLGIGATFLWGGAERSDRTIAYPLAHGDVVVWGGPSRHRFHGVRPVPDDCHARTGRARINLTFRRTR
ncbi:MAG: DNA oxidative demethylase AlkB [Nannocystaceae bacterium]|jgi:alkylated DNA repair protein (DNA oxidative demethylase)